MSTETSTDYDVDNRYRGMGRATDNKRGKDFLDRFLRKPAGTLEQDRSEDNRFVMSAPGLGQAFSYKNAFGSPRSPEQRRISKFNQ